ncbi:2'-5' RNA ligase family protein [Hymenobacter sp. J193]|uniref:2'-5' RNA ligase family protein n=1 Tax=Hymenobacter sp. J193 TaxID=2898429 RepID=UPI002150AC98|nr:2'-5' RNA ligase family protein [Hymenobacter sp. J193]MCR5886267.1 2'-5' RNA ligase family protein [Hymenobacter sp. J193]
MATRTNPTSLYLLAIVPPEPVLGQVWALKQEVHILTGSRNAVRLRPHITLWPPVHRPAAFARQAAEVLARFAASETEFMVSLRDFAWFGSRTLFISVNSPGILKDFNQRLAQWCRLHQLNISLENRPFTPHMTLATRDLPADNVPELQKIFAARNYAAQFPVQQLTLFEHDGKSWEVAAEFHLSASGQPN